MFLVIYQNLKLKPPRDPFNETGITEAPAERCLSPTRATVLRDVLVHRDGAIALSILAPDNYNGFGFGGLQGLGFRI